MGRGDIVNFFTNSLSQRDWTDSSTRETKKTGKEFEVAQVLVIDDDPQIVEAVELILEKEGHHVRSASSAAEGAATLAGCEPDVVILDVMMEQENSGLALARKLRRSGFTRPIILMTSLGRVTGFDYGRNEDFTPVDVFLEKPVSAKTLAEKVREVLEQSGG